MAGPYADHQEERLREMRDRESDPVEDMRRRPEPDPEFTGLADRVTLSDRMSQLEQTIHETHKLIERMDETIQFALKPSYPRDDVNKAVSGGLPDVSPLCKDIDTMADLARKNNRYLDELIRRIDV